MHECIFPLVLIQADIALPQPVELCDPTKITSLRDELCCTIRMFFPPEEAEVSSQRDATDVEDFLKPDCSITKVT